MGIENLGKMARLLTLTLALLLCSAFFLAPIRAEEEDDASLEDVGVDDDREGGQGRNGPHGCRQKRQSFTRRDFNIFPHGVLLRRGHGRFHRGRRWQATYPRGDRRTGEERRFRIPHRARQGQGWLSYPGGAEGAVHDRS